MKQRTYKAGLAMAIAGIIFGGLNSTVSARVPRPVVVVVIPPPNPDPVVSR